MAIYIITGAPGSGKTFYMIKHMIANYFYYDKEMSLWRYRKHNENKKEFTVISNIDGLVLPHLELDEIIEISKIDKYKFFTVEYQKKIAEKYNNLVYVIDECQRYFDESVNKRKDVLFFFEYHRHIGMDIFLMAQTYERICRNIRGIEEKHIHAPRRGLSIIGEFSYNIMSSTEIIDKKIIAMDKSIFKLYKSRERKEISKAKNPLLKYVVIAAIMLVFALLGFYKTFLATGKKNLKTIKDNLENEKILMQNKEISKNDSSIKNDVRDPVMGKRYYQYLSWVKVNNKIMIYNYRAQDFFPIELVKEDLVISESRGFMKILLISNSKENDYTKPLQEEKKREKKENNDTSTEVGT